MNKIELTLNQYPSLWVTAEEIAPATPSEKTALTAKNIFSEIPLEQLSTSNSRLIKGALILGVAACGMAVGACFSLVFIPGVVIFGGLGIACLLMRNKVNGEKTRRAQAVCLEMERWLESTLTRLESLKANIKDLEKNNYVTIKTETRDGIFNDLQELSDRDSFKPFTKHFVKLQELIRFFPKKIESHPKYDFLLGIFREVDKLFFDFSQLSTAINRGGGQFMNFSDENSVWVSKYYYEQYFGDIETNQNLAFNVDQTREVISAFRRFLSQ